MAFPLNLKSMTSLEIISFISACLALSGALYERGIQTTSPARKLIKAAIPCFMATSVWIIHHIVLIKIFGAESSNFSLLYSLLSYALLVFGFYLAIKIIDFGFLYANYIAGAIIGTFISIYHISDKYFLAHYTVTPPKDGAGASSIFLILSFIILWSCIVGYLTDYYKNREQLSYLQKIAYTDNLTNLANRNALNDHFKTLIEKNGQTQATFACMIIDLNNFKDINDNYGHLTGDEVLTTIGEKLRAAFKNTSHFLGRLGGDEFIILANYKNISEIEAISEKVYSVVVEPNRIDGNLLSVGCCIGISLFPENGATQKILMNRADISLYTMKKQRLNGICFYKESPASD
ncbi:GGDEF domain-containing protein [Acetobacter suratthaniensis]|uniref:GGDEF domain-containing protein n=1 Tax=Acetobacter suratthaniensis TaxID=1502841 RepID=A0ABS3LK20_9PROT|nr:GGDEF domain-containing protein [Acetobacter suratthaniensis]MBO1327952.1 GGDEF domain-containing protein [Acetobacter suratthaniensis]MCX2565868.1 GGDEF domain-containing protein [Acetobacter suratthaniensis]